MEKRFSRRFLVEKRTNCSFSKVTQKADKVVPKLVILFGFRGLFYNHVSAEELKFLAFLETKWAPSPIISEINSVSMAENISVNGKWGYFIPIKWKYAPLPGGTPTSSKYTVITHFI